MGIFYSNIPLTKETTKETILDMFITKEGTLTIKDVTIQRYKNKYSLHRDIKFVRNGNEYIIKLEPLKTNNDFIIGLFIAEGFDFVFRSKSDPIFFMKKENLDFNLKGFFNQSKTFKQVTIGIFALGTEIIYKNEGKSFRAILNKKGWSIKSSESVSDVAEESKTLINDNNSNIINKLKLAEELLKANEISENLFKRYKIFLTGSDEDKMLLNFITKEEMNFLKKKGL